MGTEKGLFRDPGRFSPLHDDLSNWFANQGNQRSFLRRNLNIQAVSWRAELERPVLAKNDFLIGFSDLFVTFADALGDQRRLLVEFKSEIRDKAAILRQLRAYAAYCPRIDYTAIVVNQPDLGEQQLFHAAAFFASHSGDQAG